MKITTGTRSRKGDPPQAPKDPMCSVMHAAAMALASLGGGGRGESVQSSPPPPNVHRQPRSARGHPDTQRSTSWPKAPVGIAAPQKPQLKTEAGESSNAENDKGSRPSRGKPGQQSSLEKNSAGVNANEKAEIGSRPSSGCEAGVPTDRAVASTGSVARAGVSGMEIDEEPARVKRRRPLKDAGQAVKTESVENGELQRGVHDASGDHDVHGASIDDDGTIEMARWHAQSQFLLQQQKQNCVQAVPMGMQGQTSWVQASQQYQQQQQQQQQRQKSPPLGQQPAQVPQRQGNDRQLAARNTSDTAASGNGGAFAALRTHAPDAPGGMSPSQRPPWPQGTGQGGQPQQPPRHVLSISANEASAALRQVVASLHGTMQAYSYRARRSSSDLGRVAEETPDREPAKDKDEEGERRDKDKEGERQAGGAEPPSAESSRSVCNVCGYERRMLHLLLMQSGVLTHLSSGPQGGHGSAGAESDRLSGERKHRGSSPGAQQGTPSRPGSGKVSNGQVKGGAAQGEDRCPSCRVAADALANDLRSPEHRQRFQAVILDHAARRGAWQVASPGGEAGGASAMEVPSSDGRQGPQPVPVLVPVRGGLPRGRSEGKEGAEAGGETSGRWSEDGEDPNRAVVDRFQQLWGQGCPVAVPGTCSVSLISGSTHESGSQAGESGGSDSSAVSCSTSQQESGLPLSLTRLPFSQYTHPLNGSFNLLALAAASGASMEHEGTPLGTLPTPENKDWPGSQAFAPLTFRKQQLVQDPGTSPSGADIVQLPLTCNVLDSVNFVSGFKAEGRSPAGHAPEASERAAPPDEDAGVPTGPCKPTEVVWHVFARGDVCKLQRWLDEQGSASESSPLHGTSTWRKRHLEEAQLSALARECGVSPFVVRLREGDVLLLPSGCAFQRSYASDHVETSLAFLSPQSLGRSLLMAKAMPGMVNVHQVAVAALTTLLSHLAPAPTPTPAMPLLPGSTVAAAATSCAPAGTLAGMHSFQKATSPTNGTLPRDTAPLPGAMMRSYSSPGGPMALGKASGDAAGQGGPAGSAFAWKGGEGRGLKRDGSGSWVVNGAGATRGGSGNMILSDMRRGAGGGGAYMEVNTRDALGHLDAGPFHATQDGMGAGARGLHADASKPAQGVAPGGVPVALTGRASSLSSLLARQTSAGNVMGSAFTGGALGARMGLSSSRRALRPRSFDGQLARELESDRLGAGEEGEPPSILESPMSVHERLVSNSTLLQQLYAGVSSQSRRDPWPPLEIPLVSRTLSLPELTSSLQTTPGRIGKRSFGTFAGQDFRCGSGSAAPLLLHRAETLATSVSTKDDRPPAMVRSGASGGGLSGLTGFAGHGLLAGVRGMSMSSLPRVPEASEDAPSEMAVDDAAHGHAAGAGHATRKSLDPASPRSGGGHAMDVDTGGGKRAHAQEVSGGPKRGPLEAPPGVQDRPPSGFVPVHSMTRGFSFKTLPVPRPGEGLAARGPAPLIRQGGGAFSAPNLLVPRHGPDASGNPRDGKE
eukprot:jgi/Mesvir1/2274/Mv19315-RA.1